MKSLLKMLFIFGLIVGVITEIEKKMQTPEELAQRKEAAVREARVKQIAYENSPKGQKEAALKAMDYREGKVEEYMTKLGVALELEVFIKNKGNKPITNIEFSCWSNDIRGLLVTNYRGFLSEVVPANTSSEKSYKVRLGLRNENRNWTYDCKAIDVSVM